MFSCRNVLRLGGKPVMVDDISVPAELLDVPAASPLLLVRRVAYTPDRRAVEFRRSYVNTAEHEYQHEPGF